MNKGLATLSTFFEMGSRETGERLRQGTCPKVPGPRKPKGFLVTETSPDGHSRTLEFIPIAGLHDQNEGINSSSSAQPGRRAHLRGKISFLKNQLGKESKRGFKSSF